MKIFLIAQIRQAEKQVAVGTAVTCRPPHRSVRAELPHTTPASGDVRFNFFHSPLQFGAGEIAVTIVDCLEFAAVDGDQIFSEQSQLLTQHNELATDASDGLAVVFSEVGDGLENRRL